MGIKGRQLGVGQKKATSFQRDCIENTTKLTPELCYNRCKSKVGGAEEGLVDVQYNTKEDHGKIIENKNKDYEVSNKKYRTDPNSLKMGTGSLQKTG